jgi:hypothetical protein
MIMLALTYVLVFSAGYAASIYSWPAIKVGINGVAGEAGRLRERLARLKAKLGDF